MYIGSFLLGEMNSSRIEIPTRERVPQALNTTVVQLQLMSILDCEAQLQYSSSVV